jgi:hypothetical protein
MRHIIHISGPPGAGKTVLGRELQSLYPNVIVQDTDDFTIGLSQEKDVLFQFECRIRKFIDTNSERSIIFVGILGVADNGITSMINMKAITTHLFYLDVSPEKLLQQFYTRITDIGKSDPSLWIEIARGKHAIPSSESKLRDSNESKIQHLQGGYAIQTRTAILESIKIIFRNFGFD